MHTLDLARNRHKKNLKRTEYTNVLIIVVNIFQKLKTPKLGHLWIDFSMRKNKKYSAVYDIYQRLDSTKSKVILFFHAMTECNQVSFL